MRTLFAFLVLAASACVATQFQHKCPGPCGEGQTCDATVGQCKPDPCGNKCSSAQRCHVGPPARCVDINIGEAHEGGPDEPSIPPDPRTPYTPQ